ncbi:hypothetical protein HDV01_001692 [Terramyces sp. JEL0728]|nr:hypothetical protein HDV01_001692 [Terramyces sp. JEL0728]
MANKKSSFWYVLVDLNGDIFGDTESDFVDVPDNSLCIHFRKAIKAETKETLSGFAPNQLKVFRDIEAFLNDDSLGSNTPLFDYGKDPNIPMVVQIPAENTNKRVHISTEFVSESSIRHGDTSSLYSVKSNRSSLQNISSIEDKEEPIQKKEPVRYLANDENKPYIRGYKFNDIKSVKVVESMNQTKTFSSMTNLILGSPMMVGTVSDRDLEEFHNFEVLGAKKQAKLSERAASFPKGAPAPENNSQKTLNPAAPPPSAQSLQQAEPAQTKNQHDTSNRPIVNQFEQDPDQIQAPYTFHKLQKAVEQLPPPQPAKNIYCEEVESSTSG